ncbi:MAG: glycosyltransferase [Acidobacteria bacterium]|nr:MAG: glycosyltransferase [Acidobacteriota bacterium]
MVSLVVPTRNERANIEPMVRRTAAALAATGERFELLIVDDASQDGTRQEIRRLQVAAAWRSPERQRADPAGNRSPHSKRPTGATRANSGEPPSGLGWLRLIERDHDCDLSTAVLTGWRAARGDVLGCMDADLQHPPELLTELLLTLHERHADLVLASRYTAGGALGAWGKARRLGSRAATGLASLMLPGTLAGITDPMSGFFLVRRHAAALDALRPRGYKILLELLARAGPQVVAEVPFRFGQRTAGSSKAGWRPTWCFLRQVASLAAATGEVRRMISFGAVGLTGVAVNYLAFWLLHHLTSSTALAAAAASAIAIGNNFLGDEFYTFRDASSAAPSVRDRLRRLAHFYTLSLVGLGINTASVTLLAELLPWPAALAVGIALASAWNYFSNAAVTWRRPPRAVRARAA